MNAIDTMIRVGTPLPRVAGVRPAGGLAITVTWASGSRAGRSDTVDLTPVISTLRFYAPLRQDAALFGSVSVDEEGAALVWDDGRIDMAATTVERLAEDADHAALA
jgi:hypothetical protein